MALSAPLDEVIGSTPYVAGGVCILFNNITAAKLNNSDKMKTSFCPDCGCNKTVNNTNTYFDKRTLNTYFKTRCKSCDKAHNTKWIYNNWDKHKTYSKHSMARRKNNV